MAATVIQSLIGFFLIPIYARNLPKAEFGAMDQIMQFITIVQLLGSFGLPLGMVRGFYLAADNEDVRRKMVGALFTFLFPITLIISIGIFLCARPLSGLIFAGNGKVEWIQWSAAYLMIISLNGLPLSVLRTLQASKHYAIWSVVTTIINACLTVFLFLVHRFSLTNLIIVYSVAAACTTTALLPRFFRYANINFKFRLLSPMFAFGLPLLPNNAARKVLEVAGRYMLPHYFGLVEVGTFAMGLKIAVILEVMILAPFSSAWAPFLYAQSKNPDAPALFARITGLAVMALCLVMLVIEAIKPMLLSFLGGGRFTDSGPVVSALLLGFVLNGIQYTVSPGIHLAKKLVKEAALMVIAAVICVSLNSALIPRFHSTGAALAQAGGYGFYLCSTFILSQHYYPISYPWKKIIVTLTAALLCWLAIDHIAGIIVRGVCICMFTGVCIWLDPTIPSSILTLRKYVQRKIAPAKLALS
jgi:O-antigen/teichoic acid export membrane protein